MFTLVRSVLNRIAPGVFSRRAFLEVKRPRFHFWPLKQTETGPANGPQALSGALMIDGPERAAAPPGAISQWWQTG